MKASRRWLWAAWVVALGGCGVGELERGDGELEVGSEELAISPAKAIFVLSPEERALFTPKWNDWGNNFEDPPLRSLWEAFNAGRGPNPLNPDAGPDDWYKPDGRGSQNHALLWLGASALGHGLQGNLAQYENAAQKCLRLLALDFEQGHMRHEAVGGYSGFWEGGIATMALAGQYAPPGSTSGPALLAAARRWWAGHVAVLRRLAMPDGQVALVGARLGGPTGTTDEWNGLSAAVNLQLLDPRPHAQLHPYLKRLLTPDGRPAAGTPGVPVTWNRPRHVAQRWVVLRAIQLGALPRVDPAHPRPRLVLDVYRWSKGDRVHVATPLVTGYRPARWHASWAPGTVVRVELGEAEAPDGTGKGPHPPPQPLSIPSAAVKVLGPADPTPAPPPPPPPPTTAVPAVGFVDGSSNGSIWGWAYDHESAVTAIAVVATSSPCHDVPTRLGFFPVDGEATALREQNIRAFLLGYYGVTPPQGTRFNFARHLPTLLKTFPETRCAGDYLIELRAIDKQDWGGGSRLLRRATDGASAFTVTVPP